MLEQQVRRARIVSSIAATVISLACGTNYVYSAWAPQFADRLLLSSTESNLIGLAGNLGMYSMGVPVGMFVDHRGPRPAVIAGSFLLGLGYFPLHQAYDAGSGSVALLCFFSYLTGLGGCMAFAASVKTSALNWPRHRGTATAFPLAAFGLSAFFFSLFGGMINPGDPSSFLMTLACGTFGLTLIGFFFLRVLPPPHGSHHHHHSYQSVPGGGGNGGGMTDSQQLRRTSSDEAKLRRTASVDRALLHQADSAEPGTLFSHNSTATSSASASAAAAKVTTTPGGGKAPEGPVTDSTGAATAAGQRRNKGARSTTARQVHAGGEQEQQEQQQEQQQQSPIDVPGPTPPAADIPLPRPHLSPSPRRSLPQPPAIPAAAVPPSSDLEAAAAAAAPAPEDEDNERTSLMSRSSSSASSTSSDYDDVPLQGSVDMDRSHRVDFRGWNLLSQLEFWQLFSIMGILTGIGLMTINNIGNDATALWKHWDDSVDDKFLISRQQMHVSILSLCSFSGRLLSGVGSDFLVKVLHASRVWCLVIASLIFSVAQVCALRIQDPNYLGLVSGFSGLGYGFLFGVFPSIVAESFGIHGLSQNWGFMTLSPVVSGNVFNLFYGAVFDAHSVIGPGGERNCLDGIDCYWASYVVTLAACGLGLIVTLWVIRHQYLARLRETKGGTED